MHSYANPRIVIRYDSVINTRGFWLDRYDCNVYTQGMTGNIVDATAAYWNETTVFEFGTARRVYLINGVIYKVDDECGANNAEMTNYLRIRDTAFIPSYIAIPEITEYEVNDEIVLAMEYVDGEFIGECFSEFTGGICDCGTPHLSPEVSETIRALDITDLHDGNVIVSDGIYHIIDLEC